MADIKLEEYVDRIIQKTNKVKYKPFVHFRLFSAFFI
mgnify:CR=1 FL=1